MSIVDDFRGVAKRIRYLANTIDMRMLSDTLEFPEADAVQRKMKSVFEGVNELEKLLDVTPTVMVLIDEERIASFANAISKYGQTLDGGIVITPEAFGENVQLFCDPAHRPFWELQSPNAVLGLLREFPQIAEALLRDEGILVWTAEEFDPSDALVRIVNTKWLDNESDIYSHVVNEKLAGKRCRFCTALEPLESLELQPLDAEHRSEDFTMDCFTGRRHVHLQAGVVHCHTACMPFWKNWVRIAERLAEAAA